LRSDPVLRCSAKSSGAHEANVSKDEIPIRRGFDEAMAGKTAECDGGGHIAGTRYAGRQEFTGTLTGDYIDHGDPPWRWYFMIRLTRKPENYEHDAVWCESGNLFLTDEESS
jgi:hypothetical protein